MGITDREPQYWYRGGSFWTKRTKSPPLHCADVIDSFPCRYCSAGIGAVGMRCQRPELAASDSAALRTWLDEPLEASDAAKQWCEQINAQVRP